MDVFKEVLESHPHISFEANWNITKETQFRIGQCEVLIRAISNTPITPNYREQLFKVALIKGAQATTAIEGNTLSTEEIEKIQRGESLPPSKEYQGIEIKNILEALNKLHNQVIFENEFELISPKLILQFHKMIGKDLGEYFQAIPGSFRNNNVIVGSYRPPDYKYIPDLMQKLCDWLSEHFHFEKGQIFSERLIQAAITHAYIAWIHPFSDGNGRTARLLEFYILLRAGMPNIASHILSNHYNFTRNEYYRQLSLTTKNRSLTSFIDYAVLGFRDGLDEVLKIIQSNQLEITWKKYIYDVFEEEKYGAERVWKRKRRLALNFPLWVEIPFKSVITSNAEIAKLYGNIPILTLQRDLNELEKIEIIKSDGDKYFANISKLSNMFALKK